MARTQKNRLSLGLPLLLLLPPTLALACGRGEGPEPSDDMAVVWETWQLIDDSYAGRELDAVVSGALQGMLELSDGDEYPFLTEVGRLRGQVPPHVPGPMADVWRGLAVHQQRWPEIDRSDLAAAAIGGITAGLGDPGAAYLSADACLETKEDLAERLEGECRGIGGMLTVEDDVILMFPFEDSPALKAGIEHGDELLEVEGQPVAGISLEEVIGLVVEPEATKKSRCCRDGPAKGDLWKLRSFGTR